MKKILCLILSLAVLFSVMVIPEAAFAKTIGGVVVGDASTGNLAESRANFNLYNYDAIDGFASANYPISTWGLTVPSEGRGSVETTTTYPADATVDVTALSNSYNSKTMAVTYYLRYQDANNNVAVVVAPNRIYVTETKDGVASSTAPVTISDVLGQSLPVDSDTSWFRDIKDATVLNELSYVDYLFNLKGESIVVYAKLSEQENYTKLAEKTDLTLVTDGKVKIKNNGSVMVCKNLCVYTEADLEIKGLQDSYNVKTDERIIISANKAIDASALQTALSVTENGEVLSDDSYSVEYIDGTEYNYEVIFEDGLKDNAEYIIYVDASFYDYTMSFKTLPAAYKENMTSARTTDWAFVSDSNSTDPYPTVNFPITSHGMAIRPGRRLMTTESFDNLAVSFTGILNSATNAGVADYFLRYTNESNYVAVKVDVNNNRIQIVEANGGVVSATEWVTVIIPKDSDTLKWNGITDDTVFAAASKVEYMITAFGNTVSAYLKFNGETNYTKICEKTNVTLTNAGAVRIQPGSGTNVYSNFNIYTKIPFELSIEQNGSLLKPDEAVYITTNADVGVNAIKNALTVKENGTVLQSEKYNVVETDTENKYILSVTDGLKYATVYTIEVSEAIAEDFEGYSASFKTLPTVYKENMTSEYTDWLRINDSNVAGDYQVNFPISSHGMAIRPGRRLMTTESFDNLAVSFTGILNSATNAGVADYFLRYTDESNYVAVSVDANSNRILIKEANGGVVSATDWANVTIPKDSDRTSFVDITNETVFADASKVEYMITAFGNTVSAYLRFNGETNYTKICEKTDVTLTSAGAVRIQPSTGTNVYSDFNIYAAGLSANVTENASIAAGSTVAITMSAAIDNSVETVTITDAVNGSTYTAQACVNSENMKQLIITIPEKLSYMREYAVTGDIKDIYGGAVTGKVCFITMEKPTEYMIDTVNYNKSSVSAGDTITATVKVTKLDAVADDKVTFITALYKVENGKSIMVDVKTDESIALESVNSSDTLTNTISVPSTSAVYKVRSFVWQDMDSMLPISTPSELG